MGARIHDIFHVPPRAEFFYINSINNTTMKIELQSVPLNPNQVCSGKPLTDTIGQCSDVAVITSETISAATAKALDEPATQTPSFAEWYDSRYEEDESDSAGFINNKMTRRWLYEDSIKNKK